MKNYGSMFFLLASLLGKIVYDVNIYYCLPDAYIYHISYEKIFNLSKIIPSTIAFCIMSCWTYRCLKITQNNIKLLISILFILYYIPINSSLYINDLSYTYMILSNLYWCIFVKIMTIKLKVKGFFTTDRFDDSKKEYPWILTCMFYVLDISCIIYAFSYNGFSLTLNFTDIYDVRAAFVGSTNFFTSFLFNFGGSIGVGIGIYYALKYKEYILLTLGILAQLGIYSIARQKSNLFIVLIIFFVYLLYKKGKINSFIKIAIKSVIILMGISLVEFFLFSTNNIFTVLIRRLMYYPAWLNSIYYRFFSENSLLLMSQDVFLINRFGINIYDTSVLTLINNYFFSGVIPAPNTGMFAEAYMHFGVLGVLVFPVLSALIIKIILFVIKAYDLEVQIILIIKIAIAMLNVPVMSSNFWITYIMLIPFTLIWKNTFISKLTRERV